MNLTYAREVKQAIIQNKPVIALESNIISHGMPFPQNLETVKSVEQTVRDHGAVPATIGIIGGIIKIGLEEDELESFAQREDILKTSSRDIPYVLATKRHGATTVSATMLCAKKASIKILVTGGIGGVHRDVSESLDISSDLTELARTDVVVVCSGVKTILDIPKTLEYLETNAVPVVCYQTNDFPAFYCESGIDFPFRIDDVDSLAEFILRKDDCGLTGGAVIANPIPKEDAMDRFTIESDINEALHNAKEQNITGKKVTPYLLDRLYEITGGKNLTSNIALIKHNAKLGAQVAAIYEKMRRTEKQAKQTTRRYDMMR